MVKHTKISLAEPRLPEGEMPCLFCAGEEPNRRAERAGRGPWRGFTFEQLGHDYDTPPPVPPPVSGGTVVPLVRRDHYNNLQSLSRQTSTLAATSWTLANGYRIAHKSGLLLFVHWWPSHGFKTEITNLEPEGFALVNKILKLFKPETRGAPEKLNEAEVAKVVRKLGDSATQRAVARKLGVTPRALQLWAAKNSLGSWRSMKRNYEADGLAAN
jgi:hypothetical protein